MSRRIAPQDIRRHVLRDGDVSVAILSLGCITQDWRVPHQGARRSIVLGYADPVAYLDNPANLGTIVGRVANRIGHATFALNGSRHRLDANIAPHMLHGGTGGIGKRLWQMEPDATNAVQLRLSSPDGDQGFPGRADFRVTITLAGNTLTYDMGAEVDRPTPINLAQHNYYNLMGHGSARDHVLRLPAAQITETDGDSIPTGALLPISGTRHDFTTARSFAEADPQALGYDDNFALDGNVATLTAPDGLRLTLETDQPGMQLYSSRYLEPVHPPVPGQSHTAYDAICLEAQHFPDAVNHPHFAPIIATPDRPYHQRLTLRVEATT
ncbi:aldose epimerase family protein [Shimia aestuarii]|uniref:Aldose 1-epimerase n=1 Tax=Shimia aestuarii TaxID=254406 RepID=A0A1I4RZ70_9RHOB|nr:aldose epimerase family protein [Shimia aestuarii]SFM57517.1 aldose 1-epimerase [Shimia aestuarii]